MVVLVLVKGLGAQVAAAQSAAEVSFKLRLLVLVLADIPVPELGRLPAGCSRFFLPASVASTSAVGFFWPRGASLKASKVAALVRTMTLISRIMTHLQS